MGARKAFRIALVVLASTAPLGGDARFDDSMSSFARGSLEKTLSLLLARVEGNGCRKIFSDFHDERGRTLEAVLADLKLTAPAYLSGIRFASGQGFPVCRDSRIEAFTYPNGTTIYVCERFAMLARLNPRLGAALLLHEALHTLGLRENPPLSTEITQRVLDRCGG